MGWVLCSSLSFDQIHLGTFEASLARRLASAGFPVLRFHGQGYGDSELGEEHISLGSHVEGAIDAARSLVRSEVASEIGLVGTRFGGTVAALAAERLNAKATALIQPVTRGKPYVESLLRRSLISGLDDRGPEGRRADRASDMVDVLDVEDLGLRPEVVEEISALDLVEEIHGLSGPSLVLHLSRRATVPPEVAELVARLGSASEESRCEVLVHPDALRFGLPRYGRAGGERKVDLQGDLVDRVIDRTVAWCSRAGKGHVDAGRVS